MDYHPKFYNRSRGSENSNCHENANTNLLSQWPSESEYKRDREERENEIGDNIQATIHVNYYPRYTPIQAFYCTSSSKTLVPIRLEWPAPDQDIDDTRYGDHDDKGHQGIDDDSEGTGYADTEEHVADGKFDEAGAKGPDRLA